MLVPEPRPEPVRAGDAPEPDDVVVISDEDDQSAPEVRRNEFIDWLTGPQGQQAIASFKVDGEQLFFPSHGPL